jgi:hypothetical protein
MPSEERAFVLGYVRASTGAENSNLGLDVLNIIVARFKINLCTHAGRLVERALFDREKTATIWPNKGRSHMFDSHGLSSDLVDSLVDDAKTSAWSP